MTLRELAARFKADYPPDPEVAAVARALHNARIEAIENEYERDLERMHGSFGEDYEKAPLVLAALIESGWVLVRNLLIEAGAASPDKGEPR